MEKCSKLAIQMALEVNDYSAQFDSLINLGIALANTGDAAGARSRFAEAQELSLVHIQLDNSKIPSY